MIFKSSAGMVAIVVQLRRAGVLPAGPHRALREAEERATAPRADFLVVAATRQLVRESELSLHGLEIAHHHRGCVRLPAAPTSRLLTLPPLVLVEPDAKLCRPLKDVEEFAERQPEQ